MRERSGLILKIGCGVLAALLLFQLARLVIRANPLRNVQLPELPALAASVAAQTAAKATNQVTSPASGTNTTISTNSVASHESGQRDTNSITDQSSLKTETNSNSRPRPAAPPATNSAPNQVRPKTGTNSISGPAADNLSTNRPPGLTDGKPGTNAVPPRAPGMAGPPPFMSQPGMTRLPELPPVVQARIDRIIQSEILAPFMRPMPMALLGIAGKDAFLRAPGGQSGLVKVGDELGGLKLLRIDINRVLVEQAGEQKELTIFSGLGSESLLPKQQPGTNETITKLK